MWHVDVHYFYIVVLILQVRLYDDDELDVGKVQLIKIHTVALSWGAVLP